VERAYDVVTFDCYGTLIDWEGGIVDAFTAAGAEFERDALLRAYAEIEPEVQAEAYRPYREVLTHTAARVAERIGWWLPEHRRSFLADSLPTWKPFADTNAALRRLSAAGYRLGILSNVDDDLLAGTRRLLEADFDPIVTAEQVRSYKPAHPHFVEGRRRLGKARWLHAAQSYFHDVVPARALGIANAWVNRKSERPRRSRPRGA
jgi:2-haloalkanoic acid dehalogenase type II